MRFVHFALLVLLLAAVTLHVPLAQPSTDAFQEGEYAGFGLLLHTLPDFRMPVLIHGGIDVLPSLGAAYACPADAQIVCIRGINLGLQFAAGLLLLAVLATVVGLGTPRAWLASMPAVALLWLLDAPTTLIVDAHQGTPGPRDLVLLCGLLVLVRVARRIDAGRRIRSLPFLLLGLLTGAGVFWAYNRGLALVLLAGFGAVVLSGLGRSWRPVPLLLLGAAAAVGEAWLAGGPLLLPDTVADILYWSRNAALWHRPLGPGAVPAAVLALLVAVLAVVTVATAWRAGQRGRAFTVLLLLATFGLYIAQSIGRPDAVHVRWTLWPAALLVAMALHDLLPRTLLGTTAPQARATWIAAGLCFLCLESYSEGSLLRPVLFGLADNARMLKAPLPTDRALADPDLVREADLVHEAGGCTFAADNAGLIYLLARIPPCSRFAFGAYIAPDRQDGVVADLTAHPPGVIPWSNPFWWSRIDGRSFADRTPVLARWIEANYPVQSAVGARTVRSRATPP